MKIQQGTKGDFGDFELVPEEGFEIWRPFIDFESKLLIAREIAIIPSATSMRKTCEALKRPYVIIDPRTPRILNKEDLPAFFDYKVKRIKHPDHGLKSIIARVRENRLNRDLFDSRLVSLKTGEVVARRRADAFSDWQQNPYSLYDYYVRLLAETEKEAGIKYGEYPVDLYEQDRTTLKDGLILSYYRKGNEEYSLIKKGEVYSLYAHQKNIPDEQKADARYLYKIFGSTGDFWAWFSRIPDWILDFSVGHLNRAFIRDIIYSINTLKREREFTMEQHEKIYRWETRIWNEIADKELKYVLLQFCARCNKRVNYSPRYPKYICTNCCALLTDKNGVTIEWAKLELEMMDYPDCRAPCYIGRQIYWAEEARFGGVAVQKH